MITVLSGTRWAVRVAALAAALLTGPAPVVAQVESDPDVVRILAYNVKHGLGMDGQVDLERIASVIRSLEPDIVTLQEIDSVTTRTGLEDQAARLGELTGMRALFGGFMDYRGGRYGMAMLSRYPVVEWENHRLPDGAEPRSALAARVELLRPGYGQAPQVVVVGVHLYANAAERLAQATRLVELFADEEAPVVLAGDFNSIPDSKVIRLLEDVGGWQRPAKEGQAFTFPSEIPDREIDFIMFRPGNRFVVREHRVVPETLASDHRPVLLELELLPADPDDSLE
ncbi:MAG: endonuclease/exonuclease/phosphatase family protein [Gemmatimonadetes bacterium]|nr:endonuclease/exonuclease/phosphatase family protein [Gemmatimonadota bacterium]